mgnify:CR=1 FL=1
MKFINKLQPLTYNLDLDAIDNILEMQANLDEKGLPIKTTQAEICLLYTSPSPRDRTRSRMPSSA